MAALLWPSRSDYAAGLTNRRLILSGFLAASPRVLEESAHDTHHQRATKQRDVCGRLRNGGDGEVVESGKVGADTGGVVEASIHSPCCGKGIRRRSQIYTCAVQKDIRDRAHARSDVDVESKRVVGAWVETGDGGKNS